MDTKLSGKGVVFLSVFSISLTVLYGTAERYRKPLRSIVYWSSGYSLDELPECNYAFLGSSHLENPTALGWWTADKQAARADLDLLRNHKEDLKRLKQYSKMAPESAMGQSISPRLQARFQLANQLESLGDYEGALELYDELHRKGGGPFIELRKVDCLVRLGRKQEALTIVNTMVVEFEKSPLQLLMLAPLYLRLGDHDQGEALFYRAMELDPKTRTAQIELARHLAASGRWEEAREFYELYLSVPIQAQFVKAHLELANVLEHLGELEQAIQRLELVSQSQARSKSVQLPLASLHLRLGRNEEAKKVVKRILGADPFDPNALQLLSLSYLIEKKHKEANEVADCLLHYHPQNATALALKGDITYDQGDKKTAEILYRQALALSPSLHGICNNLAWLLVEDQRAEEAKNFALQATAFSPNNGKYWNTLARALEDLGDTEAAEAAKTKSRELLQSDPSRAET